MLLIGATKICRGHFLVYSGVKMPIPANAQAIWSFLMQQGFSANAAAGIEGNIEQESGGIPTAGTNPPGAGLIQILGDPGGSLDSELQKTMDYIRANGSVADINANSPNPSSAALYFSTKYERPDPAAANNANREQSAIDVANAAASGKWPASSGITSGGTQTATLLGFPGGPFDPLNWPGELGGAEQNAIGSAASSIGSGITSAIVALFEKALQSLGIPSFKDLLIRGSLILLGLIIIILGLREFISSGGYVPETGQAVAKSSNVGEFVAE